MTEQRLIITRSDEGTGYIADPPMDFMDLYGFADYLLLEARMAHTVGRMRTELVLDEATEIWSRP